MAEARNIRNLSMQQTPLLGEQNTPLHELVGRGSGFEGATPRGSVQATPNPLATPLRQSSSASSVGGTPASVSSSATPLRTPMRDSLQINAEDDMSSVGDTPRQRMQDLKSQLKLGFSSLPQPKNEFELVLPEDEDMPEGNDEISVAMRIEDATEREDKLKAIKKRDEEITLARRSQAVKRGLPRPVDFESDSFLQKLEAMRVDDGNDTSRAEMERLVAVEMVLLLEHDAIAHPVGGGKRAGGGQSKLAFIEDDVLASARLAVHNEIAQAVGLPGANDAQLRRVVRLDASEFDKIWKSTYEGLSFDAQSKSYVPTSSLSEEARIAGYAMLIDENRDKMQVESSKASKIEKKLGVVLGGYVARSKVLAGKMTESYEELARSRIELGSFDRLAQNEIGALGRREESLREEVQRLENREREGQGRFRELMEMKMKLSSEVEEMEMQVLEAINDAHM